MKKVNILFELRNIQNEEKIIVFRNKDGYIKKRAFTLAEVLITLGIIGVIAAMTLPTLVTKIQKTIAIVQVKRVFAILSATTNLAAVDYGEPFSWDMLPGNDDSWARAKYFSEQYIIPYVKTAKICSDGNNTPDCQYTMYGLNGSTYTTGLNKTFRFYLVDGSFIMLYARQNLNGSGHRKQVTIFYDINGKKGTNRLGRDVYKLEYILDSTTLDEQYIGKILPQHINKNRTQLLSNGNEMCNKNQSGVACLALIYRDGWVFAPDYPW